MNFKYRNIFISEIQLSQNSHIKTSGVKIWAEEIEKKREKIEKCVIIKVSLKERWASRKPLQTETYTSDNFVDSFKIS